MHRVTREWLKQSGGGEVIALTADQLKVFGITWPPPKGWAEMLVGMEMTDEQKGKVESLRVKRIAENKRRDERHEKMTNERYYTWPDPTHPCGWRGSRTKPADWGKS